MHSPVVNDHQHPASNIYNQQHASNDEYTNDDAQQQLLDMGGAPGSQPVQLISDIEEGTDHIHLQQ